MLFSAKAGVKPDVRFRRRLSGDFYMSGFSLPRFTARNAGTLTTPG